VPCIRLAHLSEAQKRAYVIADNKLALNAGWDEKMLALELQDLQGMDFDLSLTGFLGNEIDELLAELDATPEGETDADETPEVQAEAVSVIGDVWILGKHRIMCGDSTDAGSVALLMNGVKACIAFTSPPYNVAKTPNGNKQKYQNDTDDRPASEYLSFLIDTTNNALESAEYVFVNLQSVAGNKKTLIEYLYLLREKFSDYIVWDKLTCEPAMAHRVLNSRFEFVYIFSEDAKRVIGTKDFRGTLSNVVAINSRQDKQFASIHKATFPVEFAAHFLREFSVKSALDLFSGTGTTIIAAEQTGRRCYAMELSPNYVDVAVRRWQNFTGKQAVHADTGKTFDETAAVNTEE
jgi:DNA modification methylase